jgi:nucleotide-binding universal stress UspA family protein
MGIKRVLVPVAGPEDIDSIAESAFVIARSLSAQVQLVAVERPGVTIPFTREYADLQSLMDLAHREKFDRQKRGQRLFSTLSSRFSNVECQFVSREGEIGGLIAQLARLADVSVLGVGEHEGGDRSSIRDACLFRSARPVLFVPPNGIGSLPFQRILIAWKNSMEAARAVAAAQPFLVLAEQVHLVAVAEGNEAVVSLNEVEQYIQLHHAAVVSRAIPRSLRNVGDVLLQEVERQDGTLLVMGAYSHARWQERILGGVTEHVLKHMRMPVLAAH